MSAPRDILGRPPIVHSSFDPYAVAKHTPAPAEDINGKHVVHISTISLGRKDGASISAPVTMRAPLPG